eukprot:2799325-Pleurochrysis_carterae.AAC.1
MGPHGGRIQPRASFPLAARPPSGHWSFAPTAARGAAEPEATSAVALPKCAAARRRYAAARRRPLS